MKVSELIKLLEKLPSDSEVEIFSERYIGHDEECFDVPHFLLTDSLDLLITTPVLWEYNQRVYNTLESVGIVLS